MADWPTVAIAAGPALITGVVGYLGARLQFRGTVRQAEFELERAREQYHEEHLRNRQSWYHQLLDTIREVHVLPTDQAAIDASAEEWSPRYSRQLNAVTIFGTEAVRAQALAFNEHMLEIAQAGGAATSGVRLGVTSGSAGSRTPRRRFDASLMRCVRTSRRAGSARREVWYAVMACVCAGIAGCGGNEQSAAQRNVPKRSTEDVVRALGLRSDNGVGYRTADGCEVVVVLTSKNAVELYAGAGDTVITNPEGTAGVKVVGASAACRRELEQRLAALR